jgi:hypothetical protein
MDRRLHRLATPLVAGVVVVVVGAAVGASLADGGGDSAGRATGATTTTSTTLTAPAIGTVLRLPRPTAGAFGGTLFWDAADCSTGSLDLATGRAAAGLPRRACSILTAAGGGALAFTTESQPTGGALRVLVRSTGREHGGPARGGATAIAGDGRVATCGAAQVVEQRPDGSTRTVPGCSPAYSSAGLIRVSPDQREAVDDRGRVVVPAGKGTLRLLAANGDAVATLRASGALGGEIEVWRNGRPDGRRVMGASGQPNDVRVSPDGATVLVRLRGPQEWALYRTRRDGSLAVIGHEGIQEGSFSPDGRYVAVVVESGIVIVDAGRLAPLAAFPANAKELAWLV